jgi:hypothetical protein
MSKGSAKRLQVALCTNNRNDPLEKVDTARYALGAIYHIKGEPLMDMRRRALASLRALTAAVSTLVVEQCTLAGLNPDPNDTADEEDEKVVDRNRVGMEIHMQYVTTEVVLTRELVGTLNRMTHGSYRESIKRSHT